MLSSCQPQVRFDSCQSQIVTNSCQPQVEQNMFQRREHSYLYSEAPDLQQLSHAYLILKVIEPEISTSLTLLINQAIHSGTFHNKLKVAKVIPIFKKGDKATFNNYRPISLLPVISKVIEKKNVQPTISISRKFKTPFRKPIWI